LYKWLSSCAAPGIDANNKKITGRHIFPWSLKKRKDAEIILFEHFMMVVAYDLKLYCKNAMLQRPI
jgi:hypothetical protein